MKVSRLFKTILSSIVIFILASALFHFDTFFVMENHLSHTLLKEPRKVHPHIKLVTIDEESLNAIGRWPWPRDVMAKTVEKLVVDGAKAVFVDIVYDEHSNYQQGDEIWKSMVLKYPNIFLPAYFDLRNKQEPEGPLRFEAVHYPIYPISKDQIGHINTLENRNGVITKLQLGIRNQGVMVPSMDVRLANVLLSKEQKISWNEKNQWFRGTLEIPANPRGEILFAYATFPQDPRVEGIPIVDVIEGKVKPSTFKDSLVLIGPYSVDFQDMHYTPMSNNVKMHGIEIHLNAIQALMDNQLYRLTSKRTGFFLLAFLSVFSFAWFTFVRVRWVTIFYVLFLFLYLLIVIAVFYTLNTIMPIFYPIVCMSIAYITSVWFHYRRERKEKNKITSLFSRYVSEGVVKQILSSPDKIKLGGIRMDVSILFVDIRGFTQLSDQMEPEQVIQILNDYLALCTEAVFSQGGTLDKFMGDGVMAVFGAPFPQEDHAKRAVKTALLIKEGVPRLSMQLKQRHGSTMDVGMGIHTGPAVIGNIGSHQRLEYTAIGDTVNLAARLESHADPGRILISESTYTLTCDLFDMKDLGTIEVKGKSKSIQVYEPVDQKMVRRGDSASETFGRK